MEAWRRARGVCLARAACAIPQPRVKGPPAVIHRSNLATCGRNRHLVHRQHRRGPRCPHPCGQIHSAVSAAATASVSTWTPARQSLSDADSGGRVAGAGGVAHEQHRGRYVGREDAGVMACVARQVAGRAASRVSAASCSISPQAGVECRALVARLQAEHRLGAADRSSSTIPSTVVTSSARTSSATATMPGIELVDPGCTSTRPTVPTAPGAGAGDLVHGQHEPGGGQQRVVPVLHRASCRRGWPRPRTRPASAGAAPARRRCPAPGLGRPASGPARRAPRGSSARARAARGCRPASRG